MATPIPPNRASFTAAEVALATGGDLRDVGPTAQVCGVSIDSRTVVAGNAFVAIRGERTDGHEHLASARDGGASLAVVRRGAVVPEGLARVEVDDTLAALGGLARHHRLRWASRGNRTIVAVGGTVGKTTAKEVTAAVLSVRGPVHRTHGNLNNVYGLPMTLLGLEPEHVLAVIELGSNAPGEIRQLTDVLRPQVGLLTHVSAVHTEKLGSVVEVAREEGHLLTGAGISFGVSQADEPWCRALLSLAAGCAKVRSFGWAADASVRIASAVSSLDGTRIELDLPRTGGWLDSSRVRRRAFVVPLLGPGAVLGLAAAIAVERCVCELADLPDWDDLYDDVDEALGTIVPVPGRLVPRRARAGFLVLDDTYNASPDAVRAGLLVARDLARASGGRVVAVLGDMLELGTLAVSAHEDVGREVVESGAVALVACGSLMAHAAAGAETSRAVLAPPMEVVRCADPMDAVPIVETAMRPEDVVLVKGSRGMRMERVVEALLHEESGAHP